MSQSSSSAASAPTKRACDSCHRRKVKCIGEGTNPCRNCISAGLACTYNAIPQKKGPKGSRAKVLSELRESQRQSQMQAAGFPAEFGFDVRTLANSSSRTPGLLTRPLVESCLEFFFGNVYPTMSILDHQQVQEVAMNMEHSTEAYCVISALCAYVMIQANMTVPPNLLPRPEMAQLSNVSLGHILLEESTRVRKGFEYRENPTHLSVLTSWLYYGCYFGLGRDNTAWTYLREATTEAQILGMHDEDSYKSDPLDAPKRRALYWLLFVAERTHALHKHRPISLYPTIHSPAFEETPSERPVTVGLELLVNLYKPFDDTFVSLWNKVRTHANPTWIAQLQSQLSETMPGYLGCTEVQAIELRISQQWLRTMVWQLCVSQGLVSSVAPDSSMTFKYPVEISRDVLSMTHQFSQQAMEVQGVGFMEKLFDIACCLTDVVACIPFSPNTFALGPRDYISQFLSLFSALRGGHTRYFQLLVAKVSDMLPNLPLPRSVNVPPNLQGVSHAGIGIVPSHINEDLASLSASSSPSYPSSELVRQLAAQTGAQLSFNTAQQSLLQPPSSRVEVMSLYDATGPHSVSHSSTSAPSSQSATPGPYESSPRQSRAQLPTQIHPVPGPSSQPQHHMQHSHHLGIDPAAAYDPRFAVQSFPVDPSMVYKGDDAEAATGPMYTQGAPSHGGMDHDRGHPGSGYGG